MKTHFNHRHNFSCPVIDDDTEDMYILLYGLKGTTYCDVLSKPPYEIAVISKLLAYLDFKRHCKNLGVPTDFYKNTDRYSMDGFDFGSDFDDDDFDDGIDDDPFLCDEDEITFGTSTLRMGSDGKYHLFRHRPDNMTSPSDSTGFVPEEVDDEPFDIEKYLAKSTKDLFDDDDDDAPFYEFPDSNCDDDDGPFDFEKIFGKTFVENSVPVDYADCDDDDAPYINEEDIKRGEASNGCDENC